METLNYRQPEPGIGLIELNRPQALNALNTVLLGELATLLSELATDPSLRVLLITGAGEKAFVAGADIAEMRELTPLQGEQFSQRGTLLMQQLEQMPMPVIALVNGYALGGGCELAMACDFILASEQARFGQPEVSLGIPPGFGGTQRLTRLVGKAMALEMITTGRQVKADEALRIGLVNRVVPAAQLQDSGMETARLIAANAGVAVRMAKQLVQQGQNMGLADACRLESSQFGLAFASDDRKEGMSAFIERRKACFSGN